MFLFYWLVAGMTAAIILQAFLKDGSASKKSLEAWTFVLVATLIWPITLPFIISSKLRASKQYRARLEAEEAALEQPLSTV